MDLVLVLMWVKVATPNAWAHAFHLGDFRTTPQRYAWDGPGTWAHEDLWGCMGKGGAPLHPPEVALER